MNTPYSGLYAEALPKKGTFFKLQVYKRVTIWKKSLHTSQFRVSHQAGAYPVFHSLKQLGVFLLPTGWDVSPSQGYPPSIKFTSTYLYTWVERGTMRVECLAQEHNTMCLAMAWARTARSGVVRTNHGVTACKSWSTTVHVQEISILPHRRDWNFLWG